MSEASKVDSSFSWFTAQRRCYHRIKSGLTWHRNENLRFLTLGSAPGMKRSQQDSFRALKERLRRSTLSKLYDEGYITKRQLLTQYAGKPLGYTPQMHYINIRTDEGPTGVLHILYFGDFLPQSWLKDIWYELTGSCRSAYIRMCRNPTYDEKRLARYCVDQYCAGQSDYLRFSCSKDWVYPGFVRDYRLLKHECTDYCHVVREYYGRPVYRLDLPLLIDRWNDWLSHHGSCSFHQYLGYPLLEAELTLFDTNT
jgi:hypothetical protein